MKSNKSAIARLTVANGFAAVLLAVCMYISLTTSSSANLMTGTISACESLIFVVLSSFGGVYVFAFGIPPLKIRGAVRAMLMCVLSALLFHVIAVLFGAPFTEKVTETFHFALILTATTVVPICCLLDTDTDVVTYLHKFSCGKLELGTESVAGLIAGCSVLGAWLGAFSIPLDWDRPWQVWPVSCVVGNLLGYILGLVVSGLHYQHRYRALQKMKIT